MLEPAMFIGLGVVAFWCYLRYPRLRPRSLVLAGVHVAVSFGIFALLPTALAILLPIVAFPARYVVLALLIPALTYLLLSWVWLIARVLHGLSGGPRGGHPVATDH
jgi:hypothetical protein